MSFAHAETHLHERNEVVESESGKNEHPSRPSLAQTLEALFKQTATSLVQSTDYHQTHLTQAFPHWCVKSFCTTVLAQQEY